MTASATPPSSPAVLTVGKKVPDFSAQGTLGEFNLRAHKRSLVLYFYPKDSTPGCTDESAQFARAYPQFDKLGVSILGCSRDSLRSHENFRTKLELPFDLLSDPQESLCQQFGVIKDKMMYGRKVRGIERSTFIIAPDGKLLREWRGVKVANHVQDVLLFFTA